MLSEMVQEHDEPIIKTLHDIKLKLTEEPMASTVVFVYCFLRKVGRFTLTGWCYGLIVYCFMYYRVLH